eukprot:CAMPEP_0175369886 /NCGR_PEP_ID=MMETSP0095-20121207/20923_1 /TAXON_ID=311494 /ORGANISM="Alexandrium monilatum, Strain CCMP3105" /LENGTH=522 /DNA_ID=CAMNT_0016668017 /DNA_START=14 /DNA_END=1580 /DNA_ORIENTATION=+
MASTDTVAPESAREATPAPESEPSAEPAAEGGCPSASASGSPPGLQAAELRPCPAEADAVSSTKAAVAAPDSALAVTAEISQGNPGTSKADEAAGPEQTQRDAMPASPSSQGSCDRQRRDRSRSCVKPKGHLVAGADAKAACAKPGTGAPLQLPRPDVAKAADEVAQAAAAEDLDDPLEVFHPSRPSTVVERRQRSSASPIRRPRASLPPPSPPADHLDRSPRRGSPLHHHYPPRRRGGPPPARSDSFGLPRHSEDGGRGARGYAGRDDGNPGGGWAAAVAAAPLAQTTHSAAVLAAPALSTGALPARGAGQEHQPVGLFHDDDRGRDEPRQPQGAEGRRPEELWSKDHLGRPFRLPFKPSEEDLRRASTLDRRITDFVRDHQLDSKVTRIMLNMNPDDVEQVLEEGMDARRCRNPTAVVVSRIRKIEREAGRPNAMKRLTGASLANHPAGVAAGVAAAAAAAAAATTGHGLDVAMTAEGGGKRPRVGRPSERLVAGACLRQCLRPCVPLQAVTPAPWRACL